MALTRPLMRRRRTFAAALETDTGVAITLASPTHTKFAAFARELTPEVDLLQREMQGSLSMYAAIPGLRRGNLAVTTNLHGGGAAQPYWATTLLAASGWSESSGVWTPQSVNTTTLTAGLLEDGRIRRIAGAKVNWSWVFNTGTAVEQNWTISGKLLQGAAATLLAAAPEDNAAIPPVLRSAVLTLDGTDAGLVRQLTIACNNTLTPREWATGDDDPGRTGDGTGYLAWAITGRDITVTLDPEATTWSVTNWEEKLLDATEVALVLTVGATDGNNVEIAAPAMQLRSVVPGDSEGKITDTLTFQCNPTSGDDEMSITIPVSA